MLAGRDKLPPLRPGRLRVQKTHRAPALLPIPPSTIGAAPIPGADMANPASGRDESNSPVPKPDAAGADYAPRAPPASIHRGGVSIIAPFAVAGRIRQIRLLFPHRPANVHKARFRRSLPPSVGSLSAPSAIGKQTQARASGNTV